MKTILFLALLLVSFSAQGQYYNLPAQESYSKGVISFENYTKATATDLYITSDSISFYDVNTGKLEKESLGNVNYIRVQTGSNSGKYAMYGGLIMGLSCLAAIMNVNSNPDMELKPEVGMMSVGFIAGGIVIGGLIGSASSKNKTYFIEKDLAFVDDYKLGLMAGETDFGDGFVGVNLRVRF